MTDIASKRKVLNNTTMTDEFQFLNGYFVEKMSLSPVDKDALSAANIGVIPTETVIPSYPSKESL